MIESELFGYKRGAFTGASEHKPGRLELADAGTFYLNEIADSSPEFQAKLLEVLETREVWRLGESDTRKIDFRLIAASNRDLEQLMRENRFRRDLYHRLKETSISLLPLRNRVDDIPPLVRHFLSDPRHKVKLGRANSDDVKRLGALLSVRDYLGNVRELKAAVRELVLKSHGSSSRMVDLVLNDDSMTECERLRRILEVTKWNRSRAAWMLGVSEGTVRNRIKKYGITKK
jgi:transcriptional regulator with GAF, ATPase, and Fis domain